MRSKPLTNNNQIVNHQQINNIRTNEDLGKIFIKKLFKIFKDASSSYNVSLNLVIKGTSFDDGRILKISKAHYDYLLLDYLPSLRELLESLTRTLRPLLLLRALKNIPNGQDRDFGDGDGENGDGRDGLKKVLEVSNGFVRELTNARNGLRTLCNPSTLAHVQSKINQRWDGGSNDGSDAGCDDEQVVLWCPSFLFNSIEESIKHCLDVSIRALIDHYLAYLNLIIRSGSLTMIDDSILLQGEDQFEKHQSKAIRSLNQAWSKVESTTRSCKSGLGSVFYCKSMNIPAYLHIQYNIQIGLIDDIIDEIERTILKLSQAPSIRVLVENLYRSLDRKYSQNDHRFLLFPNHQVVVQIKDDQDRVENYELRIEDVEEVEGGEGDDESTARSDQPRGRGYDPNESVRKSTYFSLRRTNSLRQALKFVKLLRLLINRCYRENHHLLMIFDRLFSAYRVDKFLMEFKRCIEFIDNIVSELTQDYTTTNEHRVQIRNRNRYINFINLKYHYYESQNEEDEEDLREEYDPEEKVDKKLIRDSCDGLMSSVRKIYEENFLKRIESFERDRRKSEEEEDDDDGEKKFRDEGDESLRAVREEKDWIKAWVEQVESTVKVFRSNLRTQSLGFGIV